MKANQQRLAAFISILVILSILLSGCQLGRPATTPAAPPGATPAQPRVSSPGATQTEESVAAPPAQPLSPQVLQVTPAPGEEQPLEAPLQVTFDQPMNTSSVQEAFHIQPEVSGDFEWPFPHVMRFKPAGSGFERAARYTVTLDEEARSQAGLPLPEPVQFRFTTVGFLEVAAVQPADGTEGVGTDAIITVLFNRPVVPLVAIEDQDNLPQPLTFTPPVQGQGEWVNTSIYSFTPDDGFEPATTYKGRISSGLADTTGGVLEDDFTWEFTTVLPAVVATDPGPDTTYVSPEPAIQVAFNQPMDHASAEAAFQLKNLDSDEIVEGTFEWREGGLEQPSEGDFEPYEQAWDRGEGLEEVGVETLIFSPDQPLEFDAGYQALVGEGAQAARGQAGIENAYKWNFETIEYPRIVSTYPPDGAKQADPWGGLEVTFSSPMDPQSIDGNFIIQPTVAPTEVFTYWWESNTRLNLSFPTRASSAYTVTLTGDIQGRYGQPLGEDTTIRWRTRAMDPMVYLHSPYRIGTYNAYTQTRAYVTVRNLGRVNFALYDMPLDDFLRANGENWWEYWDVYQAQKEDLIREWSIDVEPDLNESLIYGTNLAGDSKTEGLATLSPGLYFLKVWADAEDVYPEAQGYGWMAPHKQMLVVARHNLTLKTTATEALVWATNLPSGQALAEVPVVIMDESGEVLDEGETGRDGVFAGDQHEPIDPWKPVFAFVGDPERPDEDFAVAVNQWSDGISPWEFNVPVQDYQQPFAAYFFTDRAIYRPGQTVYFKGVLREDDDAHYSLPTGNAQVNLIIWDPQGTKVFEDKLAVNDMGTVNGEFSLGEEAALGFYSIEASYEEQFFGAGFQVAEYRRPEYQVTVETDRDEYVQGDEIQVSAQAAYFFGGPVADAQVRYSVLSADHFFAYQGKGWWDFTDYDFSREQRGEVFGSFGELIAEGTGTTDEQGRITFRVDADIAEYIASQRFTLEVSVTDANNQEVSNRTEAVVHKGLYYIGLRPERYVGQVDEENSVNVITVDWDSEPAPDRELSVVFSEHNWYSVRKQAEDGQYYWESTVEDVPVFTTTVTTDDEGEATVSFTPEKGGVYKVTASGEDERGNQIRSSTYMWVSGAEFVNWRQENNDRIDVVADQREYQVGDTATVLIPHPYQGPVEALITIERGHIYQHWVQTLESNSEQIEIPITEDLIPNVFVSVVIVKGEDEANELPSFKVGYTELPILNTEKELQISLSPDKEAGENYEPGETVTYAIKVTDSEGEPVEAELAVNLVDLSVISLADDQGQDIVSYFWQDRGLGVRTSSGLTLSVNRINLAVAPEAKGGGGGFGEEFGTVRREFPDTAYWNPTVRTDEEGEATVSVELPDNLTTWRLGARGATAETLVGQEQVDVVSTKDLLVRPVAPRFFVVGDRAELAAIVHNNTDQPLDVEVRFEADGLRVAGPASQEISIPAHDQVKVTWQVTVEDADNVVLRFGARAVGQRTDNLPSPHTGEVAAPPPSPHAGEVAAPPPSPHAGEVVAPPPSPHTGEVVAPPPSPRRGGAGGGVAAPLPQDLADAVEIPLPVYRYSTPEVVATAGQFTEDGQRIEAAVLPPSFDPTQGELTVQIDPSLAAGTVEGLEYLEHFPYECTEQTVSRFLPNVVTYRAFQELGLAEVRPDLETKLPQLVGVGLQRLYNQQHYDGGWGWWIRDKSDPFLTAYVLLGMLEADRSGFIVDEAAMGRAVDYLEGSLVKPRDVKQHWQANRQAFILYVLAEAGEGDLGRAVTLFDQRDRLDTFGKAYLAMAFNLMQTDKPERVDALLSDITSAAIVSATGAHWEEAQVDYYAMNTDTRSTAIVLAALARLDPDNALAPNAVRWLMSAREEGIWETTQENAWAILGLTDWMIVTGELEGSYNWQVAVNEMQLGDGSVDRENIDESVRLQIEVAELLVDEANRVVIERWAPQGEAEGTGRMYYSMYLRYYKPVSEVTALNRGVIVSRQYTLAECDEEEEACRAIDGAHVGDVIRVKLTLIAPNDLHYVVVEDPFPAGAEGVDQSLKTTSVVGEPPELERTDQPNPWSGDYGWWWFSHTELRDEKAVLFATYLPRGTYEYTYLIRASLPGEYGVIPTTAYQMYFPETFGRSDGGVFTISE